MNNTGLYKLSYIIATRNRLPFLKIALQRLIEGLLPDEEIVVVDGNSTDGAKEYLQQLSAENKIQQFISEPDHNQAHGWNKALLMARGTIIKKIIDDDVYDYNAIRQCSKEMLDDEQVDICISDCLSTHLLSPDIIQSESRLKQYLLWQNGATASFTFSDVSMLIRKSSLSFLGLYDTQFTMLDWEYALRCSYLKANILYYSGCNALTVSTPGNVTSRTGEGRLKAEGAIGKQKYNYAGDRADISIFSELKIAIGKLIFLSKKAELADSTVLKNITDDQLVQTYTNLYNHLANYNKNTLGHFIDA